MPIPDPFLDIERLVIKFQRLRRNTFIPIYGGDALINLCGSWFVANSFGNFQSLLTNPNLRFQVASQKVNLAKVGVSDRSALLIIIFYQNLQVLLKHLSRLFVISLMKK